jgi:trimethylamine---corrinoid protein Co-methyltransferase
MIKRMVLAPLTGDEIAGLQEKCLKFLTDYGVQIDHPEVVDILKSDCGTVNVDGNIVKFPRDIIEKALKTVPSGFVMNARGNPRDVILPHPEGLFYSRSNTGARSYIQPGSKICRDLLLSDVAEWGKLTDALENIDACCFLTPRDVPVETADIHSLKAILENTNKPVIAQPHSFRSIEYLIELAKVACGAGDIIDRWPTMSIIACSNTPFAFKAMDIEAILQACRHSIPVCAASLPSAGATSPVTVPGTVLVSSIEVLAVLVISQLLKPGLPVMATPIFYALDMVDARNLTASVECCLASAASVQFIKEVFNIPTHTVAFGTDSYAADGQYMIQSTLKSSLFSLAGGDMLGGAGRLNALSASSPIQLVIDDTVAGILKRIKRGTNIDDETVAWEDIISSVPGDHFLEREHTLRHCRESLRPDLFVNESVNRWKEHGGKELGQRALDKYMEIKAAANDPKLGLKEMEEMSRIAAKADEKLVGELLAS